MLLTFLIKTFGFFPELKTFRYHYLAPIIVELNKIFPRLEPSNIA